MKQLKRKNFMKIPPPMAEMRRQPPFIRSIETTDARRVYSFQPQAEMKFQIVVEFPIEGYGDPNIEVAGEKIKPDYLIEAVNFVTDNEMRFIEAFENSVRPKFEPVKVDDANFQKAAETA